ncbi:MAG: hypothetical protein CMF55_01525 [Legionellales bacterium]|nr:hypothetical protein [Legionellales bacterium]HAG62013.1 hypothetical protein [Coxiellaceae bacterium]
MALPAYDTIILQYQEEVTLLLNECVYKGYSALSSYLKTPLHISVVLYIAILGISVMQGWTSISMKTFIRSALKIGIINLLAMNWGNFSAIVVNGFQGAASEISAVMLTATPVELPHFAGEGMTGALQSLLIEVAKVGNFLFQKGGLTKLAPLFDGCVVWLTGILMIGMAFLELIMVQVLLATLFTAGPLFIILTLFEPTRVFFQRWLGALSGCVFVIIFINITVSINMSILQAIIADDYLSQAIDFPLVSFVPFYIVAILCVWQIMRVSTLAMNLGGSIGSSSLAQQASGMLAGYMLSSARQLATPVTRMNSALRHRLSQSAKSEPRTSVARPSDRVLSMGVSSNSSSESV